MHACDALFLVQKVEADGGESLNISWFKFKLSGYISVFTNLSTTLF